MTFVLSSLRDARVPALVREELAARPCAVGEERSMQLFSSISQSLDFWQTLSSCTASAARIREGEIPVQGPWKSNRKGGHALPPDGSSGQSFPLFYHPPVLPFSRNVIQHGVLYFLCPRQLHNTSALLVEICSPGLGQGVALGLTLGASL